MNVLHFYASEELSPYSVPLVPHKEESATTHYITESMFDWIVAKCSVGHPPFKVIIDSELLMKISEWKLARNPMFSISADNKRLGDHPLAELAVQFDGIVCVLHYRRQAPIQFHEFVQAFK